MRRPQTNRRSGTGRNDEQGIVILLVAGFLLFVVGAMAALAIDVVTFYTARSEAQLAADGAALAGARVLANSGMTSDPNAVSDGLASNAEILATTIAKQVATHNDVGGRTLNAAAGEVTVSFNDTDPAFLTNPRVRVQTKRTDIPTFFARIWGNSQVTVVASATAEAYNPSGVNALDLDVPVVPVAPSCAKPWVLPNLNPNTATQIFDPTSGAVIGTAPLGLSSLPMQARCEGNCLTNWSTLTPIKWQYYSGAVTSFPTPTRALPSCAGALNVYQQSIAGCVQTPIVCGSTVNLDNSNYLNRNLQTADAVDCLTHSIAGGGDSVDTASLPSPPFQFLAGADNPLVQAGAIAAGTDVLVSDSLVTVPVFDSSGSWPPAGPVTVIGFVQLFLNPDGDAVTGTAPYGVNATVVNVAGCGTGAAGQPILGNGASPVAVRLITPP